MDERMQFVARRLGNGGTLQGVWDLSEDRLQDFRSLQGMRPSGTHGQKPTSVSLRQPTSLPAEPTSASLRSQGCYWIGAGCAKGGRKTG